MPATLHFAYLVSILAIVVGFSIRLRRIKTEADARVLASDAERKRLEAANTAKADFLVNISHEIRTPMNSIIGFTDLALKSELSNELREDLDTVRTSAEWLLHIVNDVLEFSRMEGGILQLEKAPFSVADCVRSTLKIVQPEIKAKGLSLHCRIDPAVPGTLRGDQTRLRHVLFNLLDNAVKFTTSGGIDVIVSAETNTQNSVQLKVSVADTGIGVPLQQQPFVFEPFRPVDATGGHSFSRYGLGLAIAHRIVRLMGGTIDFQSQLGAGSTFAFTAQLERLKEAVGAGPATAPSSRRVSVLVAEDNAVNRRLLTKLLESAGHAVTPVPDGKEAVRMFAAEEFDFVFMDLEMPEIDGLEATRQIRALEEDEPHTRIYALTAYALPADRQRCFEAGMDGFLSKPIRLDEVLKIISDTKAQAGPRTPYLSA